MFKIKKQTITVVRDYSTINWLGETIVDWSDGGRCYDLSGELPQKGVYSFAYPFDRSITSEDGQYAFIYQNLGTKGLLLKNGDLVREINRSYYQAHVYEYPAAFYTSPTGRTYLIHCPLSYDRLDFEDVESGIIITDVPKRAPEDVFHSRLEISPDNKFLMVRGWVWHPLDVVYVYDIDACLADPTLLDKGTYAVDGPLETSIGAFIQGHEILLGSLETDDDLPLHHIAIWNFKEGTVNGHIRVLGEFGNIVGIHDSIAWDFYKYPKIIDIRTGVVIDTMEEVVTGEQRSSIISHNAPQIVYNRTLNMVAVAISRNQIDLFSLQPV